MASITIRRHFLTQISRKWNPSRIMRFGVVGAISINVLILQSVMWSFLAPRLLDQSHQLHAGVLGARNRLGEIEPRDLAIAQ